MTTQEEDKYIHDILPGMASSPSGYDLGEGGPFDYNEILPIANRLETENLALPTNSHFYVTITPKGKRIAETPGGYLGYLRQEEQRQRTEERRAKLNVAGTFGSMLIAGLAFLFSLYIYVKAGEIKELEQKIEAQNLRLKTLEAQLADHH